jgi:hypothetical protein
MDSITNVIAVTKKGRAILNNRLTDAEKPSLLSSSIDETKVSNTATLSSNLFNRSQENSIAEAKFVSAFRSKVQDNPDFSVSHILSMEGQDAIDNYKEISTEKLVSSLKNSDSLEVISTFKENLLSNPDLAEDIEIYSINPNAVLSETGKTIVEKIIDDSPIVSNMENSFDSSTVDLLKEGLLKLFNRSEGDLNMRLSQFISVINQSPTWGNVVGGIENMLTDLGDSTNQENYNSALQLLDQFYQDFTNNAPLILLSTGFMNEEFFRSLNTDSIRFLFKILTSRNVSDMLGYDNEENDGYGIKILRNIIQTSKNIDELFLKIQEFNNASSTLLGRDFDISPPIEKIDTSTQAELSHEEKEKIESKKAKLEEINQKDNSNNLLDVILKIIGVPLKTFYLVLYILFLSFIGSTFAASAAPLMFSLARYLIKNYSNMVFAYESSDNLDVSTSTDTSSFEDLKESNINQKDNDSKDPQNFKDLLLLIYRFIKNKLP